MNNNRPTLLDDWMQPNPSPRSLFANFLNDDFPSRPFPDPLTETRPDNSRNQNPEAGPTSPEEEAQSQSQELSISLEPNPNLTGQRQSSSNGGLAERMQARAGFNVPKLNTSRVNPVQSGAGTSGEVRSPYLTIPPGLSPTCLLDSPVFLSNLMVQPSPTTGKLPFLPSSNSFGDISEAFSFKPSIDSKPSSSSLSDKKESPTFNPSFTTHSENNTSTTQDITNSTHQNQDFNFNTGFTDPKPAQFTSGSSSDNSLPPEDLLEIEPDPRGENSNTTQDEDGYNWRKYGQKQVKTSEYPRSYYKCTSNNCPVKKKVERSHDGQVTEIVYKGTHNHPKPVPNQSVWGGPVPVQGQGQNGNLAQEMQMEGGMQGQSGNFVVPPAAVQMSVVEMREQATNQMMPGGGGGGRAEGQDGNLVEVSSNVSNEEEDRVTHGASVEETDEDDGQETDSKRRKLEACAVEINAASRAVREPRVVVQTTSEVDILDDGYRWRKYGQKVVKGNPNPRSYYKCTHPGCSVRKHVERASHDLKSVITTYEGRHNHEVPAARNSAGGHTGSTTANPASGLPPQSNSFNRRNDLGGPDSLARFNPPDLPLSSYGQLGQLGPHGGFNFRMGQQPSLRGIRMPGLGNVPPLPPKMSGMNMLPPNMGNYLGQGMDGRFMMPKGEIKDENLTDSGFRVSDRNGNVGSGSNSSAAVYQQMINRMNMGSQM